MGNGAAHGTGESLLQIPGEDARLRIQKGTLHPVVMLLSIVILLRTKPVAALRGIQRIQRLSVFPELNFQR